jgi:diphthamide synthase (EF-2-diphthine--ammonia ligase)
LAKNNLDLSGENGEYHTLVTDGPIFKKRIKIIKSKIVTVGIDAYLDILKYSLI